MCRIARINLGELPHRFRQTVWRYLAIYKIVFLHPEPSWRAQLPNLAIPVLHHKPRILLHPYRTERNVCVFYPTIKSLIRYILGSLQ